MCGVFLDWNAVIGSRFDVLIVLIVLFCTVPKIGVGHGPVGSTLSLKCKWDIANYFL